MQGEWRLLQVLQRLCAAESGELFEHFIDIDTHFLVAGEQAEIGVEAGSFG